MSTKNRNATNGSKAPNLHRGLPEKSLQNELQFFEKNRQKWLAHHENEFAVISGSKMAGFYPDFVSAWKAGFHEFGPLQPFLVKEVCSVDPVYVIY